MNASPHLGKGSIYTTGSYLSDITELAFGEMSPWRVLATDALSAATPIRAVGWLSGRSFEVELEQAITEPKLPQPTRACPGRSRRPFLRPPAQSELSVAHL